ncbi:hypothetical protein Tco_0898432, partial [Tanacetum coccineum]
NEVTEVHEYAYELTRWNLSGRCDTLWFRAISYSLLSVSSIHEFLPAMIPCVVRHNMILIMVPMAVLDNQVKQQVSKDLTTPDVKLQPTNNLTWKRGSEVNGKQKNSEEEYRPPHNGNPANMRLESNSVYCSHLVSMFKEISQPFLSRHCPWNVSVQLNKVPEEVALKKEIMLRVYLRTYDLDKMVQAAISSAILRVTFVQVNLKSKVPTKVVCAEHMELRKEILTPKSSEPVDDDDKPDEWYYEIEAEEQRQWKLEDEREARLARKCAKKQRKKEKREARLARKRAKKHLKEETSRRKYEDLYDDEHEDDSGGDSFECFDYDDSHLAYPAQKSPKCYIKLYDSPLKSSTEDNGKIARFPKEGIKEKEAEVKSEEANVGNVSKSGKKDVKAVDPDPNIEDALMEAGKYLILLQKHSSDYFHIRPPALYKAK